MYLEDILPKDASLVELQLSVDVVILIRPSTFASMGLFVTIDLFTASKSSGPTKKKQSMDFLAN